jgi:hypothetical protein
MSIRSLAFFNRSPCAVDRYLADTDTVTAQGPIALTGHARSGDFYLTKNGDLHLATSGDFFMATDTPTPATTALGAFT